MSSGKAAKSGTFKIGGDIEVNRLGFGAMRITGPGIWGEPADRAEALRTLQAPARAGRQLHRHRRLLRPRRLGGTDPRGAASLRGMLVATKGGLARPGPESGSPRPARIPDRAGPQEPSQARRRADRPVAASPHRPKVPRDEQFGAISALIDSGVIRHAGLSEVSVEESRRRPRSLRWRRCRTATTSSTAPARTCCVLRAPRDRLHPLVSAGRRRSRQARIGVDTIARRHGAAPSQVALAWVLKRSPVMLPIPGTSKVAHLERTSPRSTSRSRMRNSRRSTARARPSPRADTAAPCRPLRMRRSAWRRTHGGGALPPQPSPRGEERGASGSSALTQTNNSQGVRALD